MTHPTRVFDLLQYQKTKTPLQNIFSSKIDNKWVGISTEQFIQKVDDVSKGLIALGIQPNEKVGLISENRLEWNILDFAIQQIGAVVVAIYPNISNSDYEFILNDAEVRYCFVSNDQLYQRLLSIHDKIPTVQAVYTFNLYNNIPHWDTVTIGGFNIENQTLEALKAQVSEKDLATLIYTSGTTGKPKGVMLSHENLLSDVTSSEYSFPVQAYDKALTFLPACHAYERVFHYVYIKMGLPIFYARSMDTIGEDIQEVKPQIFSAVPRVLEKVYEKIMQTGSQLSGIKRMIFFWALSVGKKYDLDESKFSFWYATQLKFARKLVFSKWQQALGGEIKGIASGSATLPTQLLKLYLAAGIQIYEGYGLTEAGPCLSVNCIKRGMKIGTVGLPLIN
ncbi:MAG TPA: AMP-binding protein, partial [Taishania sp.]|nr:AMP-binding protein [Taishania sp.]